MKTKTLLFYFQLVAVLVFTSACEVLRLAASEIFPETAESLDGDVFYHNSFEADRDTSGWRGYGAFEFRQEAPGGGGKRSVFISGGCIIPHARLELGPVKDGGSFILRCWGKNLSIGGGVGLYVAEESPDYIHITINDEDWKFYESADTLYCPPGKKISLEMNSGGFVASSMLVDVLEIVQVEN